jgi:hypothetical protein
MNGLEAGWEWGHQMRSTYGVAVYEPAVHIETEAPASSPHTVLPVLGVAVKSTSAPFVPFANVSPLTGQTKVYVHVPVSVLPRNCVDEGSVT